MIQINNMLYSKNKTGTYQVWSVYVNGSEVIVQFGQEGGKIQSKSTVCKGKNIGRANETTPEQQALKEAESKWTKQRNRKGYRETKEELENMEDRYPMLALDGAKNPNAFVFPCYYSYKLNGVRGFVQKDINPATGSSSCVRMTSRTAKEFHLPDTVHDELMELMARAGYVRFDGEIYRHRTLLQDINSMLKNRKHPDRETLEFRIFDIPEEGVSFDDRLLVLNMLSLQVKELGLKKVRVVPYYKACNIEEAWRAVEQAEYSGYEGIVTRNPNGLYVFGERSRDMIKLKNMKDSEALVEDITKDKNGEGVLRCVWCNKEGDTPLTVRFECKMIGSHSTRKYSKSKGLVGSWITFKYQDLTKAGVPTFPVGMNVREVDSRSGKPLE